MKCHFWTDPATGERHLIPYCYGSLHQEDLSQCTCRKPTTMAAFEKQHFNEKLAEAIKDKEIAEELYFSNLNDIRVLIRRCGLIEKTMLEKIEALNKKP